jgi:hypothetical protein
MSDFNDRTLMTGFTGRIGSAVPNGRRYDSPLYTEGSQQKFTAECPTVPLITVIRHRLTPNQ